MLTVKTALMSFSLVILLLIHFRVPDFGATDNVFKS